MTLPAFMYELYERREAARPWSDNLRWAPFLKIRADTYKPPMLFDLPLVPKFEGSVRAEEVPPEYRVVSPDGMWMYANLTLPRGSRLDTYVPGHGRHGERVLTGRVSFDGDVPIPALWQRAGDSWTDTPWMSLTPAEIISQRPGVARAHDDVIVVGLGLGWMLSEVLKSPRVSNVTLVEVSQSLVDWVLPRVLARLEPEHWSKLADTVVGDAFEVMRGRRADIALVDIWMKFSGDNRREFGRLKRRTGKGVLEWWGWVP